VGTSRPAASWQEGAQTTQIKVLGEQFLATAKMGIHMLLRGGYASEYDAVVARSCDILAGGALSARKWSASNTSGLGARGLRFAMRRKEDAGAHRTYPEDRQTSTQ